MWIASDFERMKVSLEPGKWNGDFLMEKELVDEPFAMGTNCNTSKNF